MRCSDVTCGYKTLQGNLNICPTCGNRLIPDNESHKQAVTLIEEHLRDPLYANWVKSGLAINITNEVIRPFAVREMTNFHQTIIAVIQKGVVCTTCTVANADCCPNNICSLIKNEIATHHWFPNPSFKNTCIQSWLTDPWEIAKCYMPPGEGYGQTIAASADFSALINVIMNCRHFQPLISCDPSLQNDKYCKARTFRNTVMHSTTLKISDNDMKNNLDILIDIIEELPDLGSKDAAVTKLNEIKDNTLTLTMEDILKVRKQAMLTMELTHDLIHQGLAGIQSEIELGKQAIRNEVDKVQGTSLIANFVEGCQTCLCRLTVEHIMQQRPEEIRQQDWTIEEFLSKLAMHHERKNLSTKHKNMLFPSSGAPVDPKDWDMFLYCFILKYIELPVQSGNAVERLVEDAKSVRDDFHRAPHSVTESILLSLCDYLLDSELKKDIEKKFTQTRTFTNDIHPNNILTAWQRDDEIYSITEVSSKALEILQRKYDHLVKHVDALGQEKKEGGNSEGATGRKWETSVKLLPQNVSPAQSELFQNTITSQERNAEILDGYDGFKELKAETECTNVKIKHGSIILKVECPSTKLLFKFWKGCINGSVAKAMSHIRDAYRKFLGCDALEFQILLTKKELARMTKKIDDDIAARLERLEYNHGVHDVEDQYTEGENTMEKVPQEKSTYTHQLEDVPVVAAMAEGGPGDDSRDKTNQRAMRKQITKLFFQIAENLEGHKLPQFRDIINDAVKYSEEPNEQALKIDLRKFYDMAFFEAGISVNLLTQELRSLLTIQDEPVIGKDVAATIDKHLVESFPTLAALGNIDERSLHIYMRALEKGNEELKHIRLMVVGMFGVGKSSLVRRLRNEDISDVESTVGININVKVCELNDDGTWVKRTKPVDRENDILKRATDVVVHYRSNVPGESTNKPQRQKMEQKMDSKPTQNEQGKIRTDPPQLSVDQQRFEDSFVRPKAPQIEVMTSFRNMGKNEEGKTFIQGVKSSVQKPTPSGRKPTVSIWDFAGQSVYYSTHHFFISSRSTYLLVLDISKPLDTIVKESYGDWHTTPLLQGSMKKDYTCLDAFKFWVTSIYAYTQYKDGATKKFRPTIVLIGTYGDKLHGNRKEKELQKDLYFEKAREAFDKTPVAELFHPKTFLVSCPEDESRVFDALKADITKIAKEQPYWNDLIPAKWLPLERSIEFEKKKGKILMKFNEVDKANAENELNLEDRNEIKLFLRFQHSLGNVMYFDAPNLEDTVILDPQWIIDMFKLFVTHQPKVPNELWMLWKEYRDTAKLRHQLLEFIISTHESQEKEQKNNYKANITDVIRYMEHLDVIVKPVSQTEDFHIVPCVLKQMKPEEDAAMKTELNVPESGKRISTPIICFDFDNGCLPPSVFHRLLATYINKKQIKRRGSEYVLYNGFGAFELDDSKTLCIWYTDFIICARVTLHDKHNRILYTDDCISLRHEIKRTISTILLLDQHKDSGSVSATTADATSAFTEYIMCEEEFVNRPRTVLQSTHIYDLKVGLHNVEELKTKPSVLCSCSESKTNPHSIYKNDALKYWYEEPYYLKNISDWFKGREREDKDFLSKAVKERDYLDLSDFVNENEFNKLGSLLKIQSGTISTIANGTGILRTKVIELFRKWLGRLEPPTRQELKDKLYILKEGMADKRCSPTN